jgi:hypothetical protein
MNSSKMDLDEKYKKSLQRLKKEYCLIFLVVIGSTILFFDEINLVHYVILFFGIDAIGYWPGLLYTKIKKTEFIPRWFHRLYNLMHDQSTLLVLGLLYICVSASPYSVLAILLHLSVDRGLLGNFHKYSYHEFNKGSF